MDGGEENFPPDETKGLLQRARSKISATLHRVFHNKESNRIKLEDVIPSRSPSWEVVKSKADEAIQRWQNEVPLSIKVTQSGPMDPNEELAIRIKEAEALAAEESTIKSDLELVTGVLEKMQTIDEEAHKAEEQLRIQLVQEHEVFQAEHQTLIEELEAKQAAIKQELDKYDNRMKYLEAKIGENNQKRDQVANAIRDLASEVNTISVDLDSGGHAFRKNLKQYQTRISIRREDDTRDLMKYKDAKDHLEEQLKERIVVRKALEGKTVDVVPDASSPVAKESPTVSLDERISAALDWRNNRKEAVLKIKTSGGIKELTTEAVLAETEGYIVSSQVIRDQKVSITYKAKVARTSCEVFAKVFLLAKINQKMVGHLKGHTFNILRYIVTTNGFKNLATIYDLFLIENKKVVIFEEPLKTDLVQYRRSEGSLNEKEIRPLADSLASAVHYLHNIGVAHQNIAPNNIYINTDGKLKLAALEWSIIYLNVDKDSVEMQKTPAVGDKPGYGHLAPEVLAGQEYDPTCADVYSFGCMIIYMATGQYPKDTKPGADNERLEKWLNLELQKRFGQEARDLIFSCTQKEPTERITIREAVVHPWFADTL